MEIEIGGRKRPVKYNINALIEFEELTGSEIIGNIDPNQFARLKNMRALAFCGLKCGAIDQKKEIDFTIEDVGSWIGFGDGSMEKFFTAFNNDNAPGKTGEEKEDDGKK